MEMLVYVLACVVYAIDRSLRVSINFFCGVRFFIAVVRNLCIACGWGSSFMIVVEMADGCKYSRRVRGSNWFWCVGHAWWLVRKGAVVIYTYDRLDNDSNS